MRTVASVGVALALVAAPQPARADGATWSEPTCGTLEGVHPPAVASSLDKYRDGLGVPFHEWDDERIQWTVDLAQRCAELGHPVDPAYWLSSLRTVVGRVASMSAKIRHVRSRRSDYEHADAIPDCETIADFDPSVDVTDGATTAVLGKHVAEGDVRWMDELVDHANWCRAYLPDLLSARDGRMRASTLASLEGFMDRVAVVRDALVAWDRWDGPDVVEVRVEGVLLPPTLASRTVTDLVRYEGEARATLHGASSEQVRRGMRWAASVAASEDATPLDHAYAALVRERFLEAMYDTQGVVR